MCIYIYVDIFVQVSWVTEPRSCMVFSMLFVTDIKSLPLRAQVFWSTWGRHPVWKIQGFPAPELLCHQRPFNPKGMSVLTCLNKYNVCLIIVSIRKISTWVSTEQGACLSRNKFSKVSFKGHVKEGSTGSRTLALDFLTSLVTTPS